MYTREDVIERNLVKRVRNAGGIAIKMSPMGYRGIPDRLVILPGGEMMFVECKAPGRKRNPHQIQAAGRLESLGVTVKVLDSKDLTGILPETLLTWI